MRIARRSVVLMFALAIGVFASAGLAQANDSAWKAAHDTDPHLALTAEQLEMTAAKRAAEKLRAAPFFASIAIPGAECGNGCGGTGGYPASASIVANQTPQATSYYCGPAAVHEALDALGVSLSQSAAAAALHTTTAGTAWSGGGTSPSGYPVPDVLNRYQSRIYYVPQPVSTPTSSAINTYEGDLEMDIAALRAAVVGDAWETQYSAYHLVGHPTDHTIYHWFEIRGYQNSGATTMYEDSVHGATSISWAGGVPAYSTFPSTGIVSIVSGRGYVW
jgi:Tfp pilus assembly protein PilV